jgi:hypothetical protein
VIRGAALARHAARATGSARKLGFVVKDPVQ